MLYQMNKVQQIESFEMQKQNLNQKEIRKTKFNSKSIAQKGEPFYFVPLRSENFF